MRERQRNINMEIEASSEECEILSEGLLKLSWSTTAFSIFVTPQEYATKTDDNNSNELLFPKCFSMFHREFRSPLSIMMIENVVVIVCNHSSRESEFRRQELPSPKDSPYRTPSFCLSVTHFSKRQASKLPLRNMDRKVDQCITVMTVTPLQGAYSGHPLLPGLE
jgi:hypothetical protein